MFPSQKNPREAAFSTGTRVWRTIKEGLTITAKGSKEGKTQVRFLVAIAYDAGVVICHQVQGRMKGVDYAEIIRSGVFESAISKTVHPTSRTVLQDNCPVQNSGAAKTAFSDSEISLFQIPPRSPDINCIENFFAHVKAKLRKDALEKNITQETKQHFCERIIQTLENWCKLKINKLINSIPTRIEKLIEKQGDHIPY